MDKIFLDTNIVVDFLCERGEFYLPAAKIFITGYNNEVELYCSSLTYATASYLMKRSGIGYIEIRRKLMDISTICHPSMVDNAIVTASLNSSFVDFEDALQYFSAKSCGANIIITRNKKDFSESELPLYQPNEYLNLFSSK